MRVDFDDSYWPSLFKDPVTGTAVSVTKGRNIDMLKGAFTKDYVGFQGCIFMQEGAPAHTSRLSLDWLEMTFTDTLI